MNMLDHADIVVTHACNMNCPHCIDPLRGAKGCVSPESVRRFMRLLSENAECGMEVLFLGGEPTMAGPERLIELAGIVRDAGFSPIISTNGVLKDTIRLIQPYFDWIQVTTHSPEETDFWREENRVEGNINLKIAGDANLTYDKLMEFMDTTQDFKRRSVSMYFTSDFKELCEDSEVWALLNTMEWHANGSYMYAMYEGVRFKKCIPGMTNIADEPAVPKLYPNGNYNRTWCDECMDEYLGPLPEVMV